LGNVIRLSRTPGVPGKLALLKQEAFPGADFMRTRSDLARRGSVGLAAAYALRLVKLTWQVPRAHLALRRARRASNRRQRIPMPRGCPSPGDVRRRRR